MTPRAFVTLHDVAPAVLDDCVETLDALADRGIRAVTLLVVPGAGWTEASLGTLRGLQEDGYALAGHGWSHRAKSPRSLYHRAHAAVLSRDEGEHLSRERVELEELVRRCHAWFDDEGLAPPSFYVPPAWAMGRLSRSDLQQLPFRFYESLAGIYDASRRRFRVLPLVGYLADTRTRAVALRLSNALNRLLARVLRRPLRIAIHPPDLRLHLRDDLLRDLDRRWKLVDAARAVDAGTPAPARVAGDVGEAGP